MEPELRAQVDRADEAADALGTEIRGEHLLDALAQLGLRLDANPTPESWRRHELDATLANAVRVGELLPELDPVDLFDQLTDLNLLLVPLAAGEPNVASHAWMALVDADREQRGDG